MKSLSGIGVGYREPHSDYILEKKPNVDWFEILSDNYLADGGPHLKKLQRLSELYPLAMHGVGLSIGSCEALDYAYLEKLKNLKNQIQPLIISDHVCWSGLQGIKIHDLLPLPLTEESLALMSERVMRVQDFLNFPLTLENPTVYFAFASSQMDEAEFLAELVKRSGCQLLLDLNNVYVNSKNHSFSATSYLDQIPTESVVQFHLAGHTRSGDILIDSHSQPVPNGVWKLYSHALSKWTHVPTLIEWDNELPDFSVLLQEAKKARELQFKSQQTLVTNTTPGICETKTPDKKIEFSLQDCEEWLLQVILQKDTTPNLNILATQPGQLEKAGLQVYQEAYQLRAQEILTNSYPTLFFLFASDEQQQLAEDYIANFPPTDFVYFKLAQHLESFFRTRESSEYFGFSVDMLADIAQLDWARAEMFTFAPGKNFFDQEKMSRLAPKEWETLQLQPIPATRLINLNWDIAPTWLSVHRREQPEEPEPKTSHQLVHRTDGQTHHFEMAAAEAYLWQLLKKTSYLHRTFEQFHQSGNFAQTTEELFSIILDWSSMGLLEIANREKRDSEFANSFL